MAFASLSGGLALANARLGAVHGFAGPLGGLLPIPHGAACAALLAPVARANVAALRAEGAAHPALARYAEAASLAGGSPSNGHAWRPEDAAVTLGSLGRGTGHPGLAFFGLGERTSLDSSRRPRPSSSMRGNPSGSSRQELQDYSRRSTVEMMKNSSIIY